MEWWQVFQKSRTECVAWAPMDFELVVTSHFLRKTFYYNFNKLMLTFYLGDEDFTLNCFVHIYSITLLHAFKSHATTMYPAFEERQFEL